MYAIGRYKTEKSFHYSVDFLFYFRICCHCSGILISYSPLMMARQTKNILLSNLKDKAWIFIIIIGLMVRIYTGVECAVECPLLSSRPFPLPSLLASSQLSLIFLRQTAARAMSSTSRHTARPTVTHRASGGKAMFWPEAKGTAREGAEKGEHHYSLLQS